MSLAERKIYIIGQGIAGSVLAFLLDKKGCNVQVIDDGYRSSSSMVAAGMWNPVSFKRMSQSWMADDLLPAADAVYREMENVLNASFYHPVELVKIFPDNKTANNWDEHSVSAELGHYLTSAQDEDVRQQFHQPFGHGVLKNSGWLDMRALLIAVNIYFKAKGKLQTLSVTKQDISRIISDEADTFIILATGTENTALFSDKVSIIPNKGEVLTIASDELHLSRMVNFGKFLIPLGGGKFRLGATYDRGKTDIEPTEKGKKSILSQLHNHYKKEVTVVNHLSGYRPTTKDRRPILGLHPDNARLAFFNGFGSKGVMLVPFFAQHFISFLNGETPLMKEVSVMRYFED